MHALGCDADEALARLRRESQRRHVKVTEVAAEIVAGARDSARGARGGSGTAGSRSRLSRREPWRVTPASAPARWSSRPGSATGT